MYFLLIVLFIKIRVHQEQDVYLFIYFICLYTAIISRIISLDSEVNL